MPQKQKADCHKNRKRLTQLVCNQSKKISRINHAYRHYLFTIPTIVPQPYAICTKKNIIGKEAQYFHPNFLQADIVANVAAMPYNTKIDANNKNKGQ